jgi:AAA15 family ATPase/GTPase
LKSLGDGITRFFHIIVALVNAQNGILLVDEFENGLYWKVQPLFTTTWHGRMNQADPSDKQSPCRR